MNKTPVKITVNGEPLNDLTNLCNKLESCKLHISEENKENLGKFK